MLPTSTPRRIKLYWTRNFLAMFAASGCALAQPAPSMRTHRPQLLVFVTVDQMRADYFARFGAEFTGGLRRLRENGAFFPLAFHDHAITETAPGHAATLSGRFPVHTGIAMNAQGVNGVPDAQVINGRPGESASPYRFRGTTLIDWLRAADSSTQWLSVSRKDRGAILPIGKSRGNVYWYHPSGTFTTSRYYADSLPAWVQEFNAAAPAAAYAGKSWTLLRDASAYPEPDSVGIEANSVGDDFAFPHAVPSDPDQASAVLANYPFMDELTLRFALRGVHALGLGATPNRTDVLAVSLSTTDAVGHRWGPDSRELHDQILRVDQYLGVFLDSIIALRGAENVLIALTSDHGVTPFPTLKSTIYPNGSAKRVTLDRPWRAFQQKLLARGIDTAAVVMDNEIVVVVNPAAFGAAGADALLRDLARDLMRVQGVQRADLMSDLARADTVRDTIARRWLHMFTPQSNVRLVVTLEPYSYWLPVTYATHGSPSDADANVPIAFLGPGIKPGIHREVVRVVDIAPTLAAILGVRPLEPVDGRVLRTVVP
jgi:predicted AlkP superfamily pyrophosphatase or phosphodiesterase